MSTNTRRSPHYAGYLKYFDFIAILVHRARWTARHAAIDQIVRDSEDLPFPREIRDHIRREALAILPGIGLESLYGTEEAEDEE